MALETPFFFLQKANRAPRYARLFQSGLIAIELTPLLCVGHIRLFFRQNRIHKTIAYAYKDETYNNKKVVESIGPTVFVDNDLET